MNDRYIMSGEEMTDGDLKKIIREELNKGNIPRALCHHYITNKEEPKFSLFLNICGVNGIIGGCSNYCIANLMVMLLKNDRLRCLECLTPFTLESTMKVRHDNYNNGYLYCSQECYDKSPTIITKCPHIITTKDFINVHKSVYYIGDRPSLYCVKLCCKKCPIIICAYEIIHCYVCKNVITITKDILPRINVSRNTYFVCSGVCYKKIQVNFKECRKCRLYGNKQCANCKTFYCSRECQKDDWEVHKSTCTKTKN